MGAPIAEIVQGAVEGAANTALSAYQIYKNREDIRNAKRSIGNWESSANKILDDAYKSNVRLSDEGDLERYQKLKADFDPSKFVYDPNADTNENRVTFNKDDYNVEKYLNPYRQQVFDDIAAQQNHSAAGAGLGHSSGALASFNKAVADKSAELYDSAFNKMQSERNFDYGMYTDYINQQQQKLNAIQQGYKTQMDMYRGDIQFDQDQTDNYVGNKLALGNSTMQAKASLV